MEENEEVVYEDLVSEWVSWVLSWLEWGCSSLLLSLLEAVVLADWTVSGESHAHWSDGWWDLADELRWGMLELWRVSRVR